MPAMLDSPMKKRSLFGAFNLFSRGTATTDESETMRKPEQVAEPTLLAPRVETVAPPESPAKRASEAVMQTRKIINRPQGPSSRLHQEVNGSANHHTSLFPTPSKATNFASSTITPRRMPGDNPHKYFSQTVNGTSSLRPTTNFTGVPTTPRIVVDAPTPAKRHGTSSFAPRIPADIPKAKFPPTTPGKSPRASVADMSGRNLAHTPSASSMELFNQRIPSPPRHLTGEFLAKEVPENHDRPGSIYADEFLAHYCPPDFNEVERRQFFCILDLRRLKFAADEIFVKRDWKINILNFAKEYEKSRSLIMLRYGLYEFKTVRASQAVTDEWKQKHGIPPEHDDTRTALRSFHEGGGKRKAEEELTPADSTLAASPVNTNKRARATERQPLTESSVSVSNKNKRRMDFDVAEESQPSKLQKFTPQAHQKAPPSATKSIFEKITNNTNNTNNTSNTSASPSVSAKAVSKVDLPNSTGKTSNGLGGSVFDSAAKPTATNNIFGHLSDNSKGSGNEDADAESGDETGSEPGEEPESEEVRDGSSSDRTDPVSSGGATTPQPGGLFSKVSVSGAKDVPNLFAKADDAAKSRSIFERLTYGNDGHPVRKLPQESEEKATQPASPEKEKAASPFKDQSAAKANQTWNTGTPIKFAPAASQSGSLFSSTTATQNAFGAAPLKKPESAEAPISKPAEAAAEKPLFAPSGNNIFLSNGNGSSSVSTGGGADAKPFGFGAFGKPEEKDSRNEVTVASGASDVSGAKPTSSESSKPEQKDEKKEGSSSATVASGLFGVQPPTTGPAESMPSIFSSAAPAAPANFSFGGMSNGTGADVIKPPVFQSTTLFGNGGKSKASEDSSTQPKPLFGAVVAAASPAPATPSISNFAGQNAKPAGSLFGLSSTPAAPSQSADEPAAKKPAFGASNNQPASGPLFGFGNAAASSAPTTEKPAPASQDKPLFGGLSTFSASNLGQTGTEQPKPFFGIQSSTAAPTPAQEARPLFGQTDTSKPTQGPVFSFGQAETPKPAEEAKPLFGQGDAPKSAPGIFANPSNGSTLATPGGSIFKFDPQNNGVAPASSSGASNTQLSASIFGNNTSSSFTFGTGNDVKFSNPFTTNGGSSAPPSFDFGSGSGAGSSTPSAAPFVFGSAKTNESASSPFAFGASTNTQTPTVTFGGATNPTNPTPTTPASQPTNMFGAAANGATDGNNSNMFSFGGTLQQPGSSIFSMQKPPAVPNMFGGGLAPGGGTSTGTNTPFTFGGASSLATTPAAGTPEPSTDQGNGEGKQADGGDAPQEQISLTEGGPGEEDESVVHEVGRAKAIKLLLKGDKDSDDESSSKDGKEGGGKDNKSPWRVRGVGRLRILKHKTTGAVRMLMRAEPRGHIVLNRAVLPTFNYKAESKYVKLTTSNDDGTGLETWMLQVKTEALARDLAAALEANKGANKKA